ncbi:transcriptional regulator ATRX homolog isoform X4 [Branchiostoma lanceolatum]|uniref:transcriptional regulator ATRX homolog isoform X4 n=1 Tax=Branchiostoma lanceolatum TaxID=7740 RepID=UPI0034522F7D
MAEKGKSRGFNLDSIVQKLQEEGSPPPSSGTDTDQPSTSTSTMVKTGASRRKPAKVVRQVASDDESDPKGAESNDDIDADAVLEAMRKASKDQHDGKEEKKEVPVPKAKTPPATPRSKGAAPDELPEGTVIVQPEAVLDDRGLFRGPEFSRKHKRESEAGATPSAKITVGAVDQIYHCTACGGQIFPSLPGTCKRHPALKVLICKRCDNYYSSDNFDKDENGIDEQCRWCAEGGNLLCCDFCTNAFCKACIKRNLGRREMTEINESDEWRCYVCDPFHLSDLVAACDQVMELSEREKQKQKRVKKDAKKEDAAKKQQGKESQDDSADDVQVVSEIKGTKPLPVQVKVERPPQPISVPIDPYKRMTVAQIRQLPPEQQQMVLNREDRRLGKRQPVVPVLGHSQLGMHQSRTPVSQPVVYVSPVVSGPQANVVRSPSVVVSPDFSSMSHNILTSVLHMHTFLESLQQRHAYLTGQNSTKTNYLVLGQAQPVLTDALKEQLRKAQPVINNAVQKITTIQKAAQELLEQDPQGIPVVPVGVVSANELANNTSDDDTPVHISGSADVEPVQNGIAVDDTDKEAKDSDVEDEDSKATKRKLSYENKSEDAKRSKQGEDTSADEADSATDKGSEKKRLRGKGKVDRTEEDVESEAALKAAMMDESTDVESDAEGSDSGEEYSPSKRRSKRNSETPNSQKRLRVQKTTPKRASRTSLASDEDETSDSKETRRSLRSKKQEADSTTKSTRKGKRKGQDDSDLSDTDKEISELEKKALQTKGSSKKKIKEEDFEEEDEEDDDKKEKSIKKEKKGGKKEKKERKKRKAAKNDSSSSDDDDDNEGDDDDDNEGDDDEEGYHSEDMYAAGDGDLNDAGADNEDTDDENPENAAAKKKLLADMDDDEGDSSSENSDSAKKKEKKTKKKKEVAEKKAKEEESVTDEDEEEVTPKKKSRKQHPLLRIRLESSDSDGSKKPSKKRKRAASKKSSQSSGSGLSGSEDGSSTAGVSRRTRSKKTASDTEKVARSYKKGKGKKKRRRIKIDDSDSEGSQQSSVGAGSELERKKKKESRKKIRKVWDDKKLTDETKQAAKAEEERRKRLATRQEEGEGVFQVEQVEIDESSPVKCPITTRLVLEKDPKTKEPLIEVDRQLCRKLKPHQVEGVRFLWDSLYETVEKGNKEEGSGAILAHCMGLGKTLQVVTLVHTVVSSDVLPDVKTCLVVCPINTVLNWKKEFEMWLDEEDQLDVWELSSIVSNQTRKWTLEAWQREGGVMLMGYDMYRNLSTGKRIKSKKIRESFHKTLVDPGPDLVVCDEGHILKNEATAISKAMNDIKSKRRIVLTGTPLQNNLTEYHCMVNFVKPNLLGTKKEFCNRFANPISNGQASDSTQYDVKLMKRRAHILHQLLAGCVQRRDYSALTKFLSPKYEYVIKVRLSPLQIELYEHFLNNATRAENIGQRVKTSSLFADYQSLMRVWTHPWVLRLNTIREENRVRYDDDDSMDEFLDDESEGSESEASRSGSGDNSSASARPSRRRDDSDDGSSDGSRDEVVNSWKTRSRCGNGNDPGASTSAAADAADNVIKRDPERNEWFGKFLKDEHKTEVELSGKLVLLFNILKQAEELGDKVLVFSQSLLSLDLIEDFLEYLDGLAQSEDPKADVWMNGKYGWGRNLDYFRMDGSTSAALRERWAEIFNSRDNERARLFLISTRAGGLGINLVGANRVIIFDASWNPSHDVQSIFRVYRFGQGKPVFVYRFLAQGTMEEKIYDRQVTKQSLAARVVDEHQIERHFTMGQLAELYNFTPDRLDDPNRQERPTPKLPVDLILADLLQSHKDCIVDVHEHDSLLENQEDETLTEEERKAAWEEYENEKKGLLQRRGPYQDPRFQGLGLNQLNNFQMEQRMREMQAALQAGHQVSGTSPLYAFNYGQQLGVQMDNVTHQIAMERSRPQPQPVMSLGEIIVDQQKRYPHLSRDALAQRAVYIQEQQKRQVQMHEERHAAIRRYEALCQQQRAAVQALVNPQKATGDPSKILASFIAETEGLKQQGQHQGLLKLPKQAKPGTLAAMIQESRRNGSANMQQPSGSRIDDDGVIILDSPEKN